jgi:hypothetical protein
MHHLRPTSPTSVGRLRTKWGIYAAGATTKSLGDERVREIVRNAVATDAAGSRGVRATYDLIRHQHGAPINR